MQNTITDFFSGITLGIDKSYHIGDWIEFEDGTIGQVVDITWRSTRIRSWNTSLYVVSNKKAAHIAVHNYSRPTQTYGYWFNVSVSSEVSPFIVRQLLLEAALKCNQVADDPLPNIYLSDISTQPFTYMVFVHFFDYPMRFPALDELHLEIYRQFRKANITPAAIKYEVDARHAKVPSVSASTVAQILHNVSVFSPISHQELDELSSN